MPLASEIANHVGKALADGFDLADSYESTLSLVRGLAETLDLSDGDTENIARHLFENLTLDDTMTSTSGVGMILAEAFSLQDRLGIGGVWDNPTSHIYSAILKASFYTEIVPA